MGTMAGMPGAIFPGTAAEHVPHRIVAVSQMCSPSALANWSVIQGSLSVLVTFGHADYPSGQLSET